MQTPQPAGPRQTSTGGSPKNNVLLFPLREGNFILPLGATPRSELPAEQLHAGDSLSGHIRNAAQLVRCALDLPELLTPELLRDISRRLEHAAALAGGSAQVFK